MDRLQEILALLERSDEINDEQLAALETELLDLFDSIRAGDVEHVSAEDAGVLRTVVTSVQSLQALAGQRMAEAADRAAEIADLELILRPPEASDLPVEEGIDEGESPVEDEAPVEVEDEAPVEVEAVEAPVPVLAAAPPLAEVRSRAPQARTQPRQEARPSHNVTMTGPHGDLADMGAVAEAMAEAINRTTDSRGDKLVATVAGAYPESRVLSPFDQETNKRKVLAVTEHASDPASWTPAMVASGGFCAPTEVDYGQVVTAVADRPVWNGLGHFMASRGGVRMPCSPTLGDVTGVGVHCNQDDIDGDVKVIQTIDCSTFNEFLTCAITRRLRFGNFGQRAFPENLESWNELLLAAWARLAEGRLLDQIKALSTNVTTPQVFGASRDIVEAVIREAAAVRSADRMASDARFRVLLPEWVIDMMAADLTRSHRDDGSLRVSREGIRDTLSDAGVNVTLYKDTPSTGTSQIIPVQDPTVAEAWPCDVQWALFPEGRFVALDGGTLDLGIVRDSVTNETNDAETFAESFEGIATACGGQAKWVTSTVLVDGSAAADIDGVVTCGS